MQCFRLKSTTYRLWQTVADSGRTHLGYVVAGGRQLFNSLPLCHQPGPVHSYYPKAPWPKVGVGHV